VSIADSSTAPLGKDGVLTWLTLGLIPSFGSYAHDFTVKVNGRVGGTPIGTSTEWVFGWVGLAMSLLPDWESEDVAWWGPYAFFHGESLGGDRIVLSVMRIVAQQLDSK
jgi:hypothetical protein